MALKPVPTLSAANLVYDTRSRLAYLFAHGMVADASQSHLYWGRVMSFQKIQSLSNGDPDAHATALQQGLQEYMGRYFERVDVTVEADETDSSRYTLTIDLTVFDGEEYVSLGYVLLVDPITVTSTIIQEINR